MIGKDETPTRKFAWLRNPWGVMGIVMAAYVALFLVWTIFHWGGEENAALISDVAYLPVSLFTTLCALKIAWTRKHAKSWRIAWLILGLATFSNFLADIAWFGYEIVLQTETFPSLADVFYLAYYPLALLGMLALPTKVFEREGRVKFTLDLLIVLVSAWLPIWFFLVLPMAEWYGGDLLMQVLAAAYPVGDLVLLTGLVAMLLRQHDYATRKALGWIFGGLVIWLAGDIIYSYQSLLETYQSGSWVDNTWLVGYLFLGFAALRSAHVDSQDAEERPVFVLEWFSRQIPFISSAFGYVMVVGLVIAGLGQGSSVIGILVGGALLTALVIARQLVEIRENQHLAANLRETTRQLQELSEVYAGKAREREQEINLAASVSRQLSELHELETLLGNAVSLIQERFELYHTQIYLLDPGRRELVLRTATGEAGKEMLRRKHRLGVNLTSINGSAAVEKRAIIVEDTTRSPVFKPNPLLPETRSEMAVPLLVGAEVVGVLDMQSALPEAFGAERLPVFEAMAGQLAIAIHNASLFAEVERAREEAAANARRLTQANWHEYVDGIIQPEWKGYIYRAGEIQHLTEPVPLDFHETSMKVPISVAGGQIGRFQLELENQILEEDLELVKMLAEQVAQQAENLRLLEQAARYRQETEKATRRLTGQGWETYLSGIPQERQSFVYNQNEVSAWEALSDAQRFYSTFSQTLNVRGQEIGNLEVAGMDDLGEDGQEILAAVSEQLSAHLENLRLYSTAQQELAERRRTQDALTKFRLGIEQTMDAVFITDTQGEIIYVNPAFEKVYGYTREEALGKTPRILKSGLIPQEQYAYFWSTLLNKQVVAGEIVNKSKDGRMIPIEGANTPIVDEQGEIIGFLALHRDISERKQAQENLAKRATELATVARLSASISAMSDPVHILQTVVDQAKQAFGLYHAHVYTLDEGRQTLALAAGAGEVGRQMVDQGWEIPLGREHSLVAQAARTRQGVISNDVTAEVNFMPNPLLPETRAEMAIPIMAGEKVLGVLDVQAEQVGRFTQEDVNIQSTLASQVAVALENAALFQQVQRQAEYEAMINTISQKIQSTTTVESALQVAIRELGRALGAERTSVYLQPDYSGVERRGAGEHSQAGHGARGNGKRR